MIELIQHPNKIIGSKKALEELALKDKARILTVSDTHGDWRGLLRIVKKFGPSCDALFLLGDCYHDLEELLELANEKEEVRNVIPPLLAFVKGNCDARELLVSFDIGNKGNVSMPDSLLINVNGQNIYLTHGHLQGVDFGYNKLGLEATLNQAKYALHGHTHVPVCEEKGNFVFINPGSISRPRGGSHRSFAILTVEKSFIDAAFICINDNMGEDSSYSIYTPF